MKYIKITITISLFIFILVGCIGDETPVERSDTADCWVYDEATKCLMKISHDDGSILSETYGFENPVDMEIDPTEGELWILDNGKRALIKVRSDGNIRKVVYGFDNPTVLRVIPDTGNMWVVDGGQLIKVSSEGEIMKTLGGFEDIRDIDVAYSFAGNLWVAEPQKVTYITEDGEVLREFEGYEGEDSSYYLNSVVNIEAERDEEKCWIADHNEGVGSGNWDHILLISPNPEEGQIDQTYAEEGYDEIANMEFNFGDWANWVIFEESTSDDNPVVVRLDFSGEPGEPLEDIVNPVSLSVDTASTGYFVWVGDAGAGRVYQVYNIGYTNLTIKGIASPKLLAVVNKNY